MMQHIANRDFITCRNVIDSVRSWKDTQPGALQDKMTNEEFQNDPLGEKKRMEKIRTLNNSLKPELFDNKMSKDRAKNFATELDMDATKERFGRNNEFVTDERFQELYQ